MAKTIKSELLNGFFYTALSKYVGIVFSLIVAGVLARLLSPSDFGIIAVATILISFFSILSDLGIGPAIIQRKELCYFDLSNIYSLTVILAFILSLVFFVSSWFFSSCYNSLVLLKVCQLLSLNVFFTTINIVPNALLFRDKCFKFIAYRTLIIQVIGGAISIVAAFSGWGIYSLTITPIFSSIVFFIVSYTKYPLKFSLKIEVNSLKTIFFFSLYSFLFDFINYFSRNLDKLLIGKFMSLSQLGYYEKSYRLMMLPLQNITNVLTPVMHPILSIYQENLDKLVESYFKILKLLLFIGFPLSVLLYFVSGELVLLVFGNQWHNSIPIFKILSISVGIQVVLSSTGSIFQAANSTKLMFISGFISAIVNILGLMIGLFVFKSLTAIAWSLIITFTFNFFQTFWIMCRFVFNISFLSIIKLLFSPLLLSLLMFIIFHLFSPFLFLESLFFSLLLKIAIYLFIYIIYLYVFKVYRFSNFSNLLKN